MEYDTSFMKHCFLSSVVFFSSIFFVMCWSSFVHIIIDPDLQYQKHTPLFPSYSDSSVSSYSEMKSSKTVSRKRWARSVSFELDGDLYAVDLEEGYRPLGSRNSSWTRDRRSGAGNEEDNDEFSGMGVTAKPTTSNRLTPPAALKVTYRCVCNSVCTVFL